MPNQSSFVSLAGVPFHYARPPIAPYGTQGTPRTFYCNPRLVPVLAGAVKELSEVCPLGKPSVITSAGTFVNKPGQHGKGLAVDIDAIFWPSRVFVTKLYPSEPSFYLAIEAIFRRHFGLGLNYLYNAAHHDHFHLDLSLPVDFVTSSKSYTLFLQASLVHIHGEELVIDGLWGPQTEGATKRALKAIGSSGTITNPTTWKRYLLETAKNGFGSSALPEDSATHHVEVLSSVVEHLGLDGDDWQMLRGSLDALLETPEITRVLEDDTSEQTVRLGICKQIVNFEARRNNKGKVVVYKLPKDDGGGRYEVAGINEKYHPEMAAKLKRMIEKEKRPDRAEALAVLYIATYTDAAARWTRNYGVEAYLRDSIWNRGAGGAAKILQKALGFKKADMDGLVGPQTLGALASAEAQPHLFLSELRAAREYYERVYVKRDESSQFWKGLVNRWNKALTFSKELA